MAKRSLRILLTNHQLGEPGGSEVNVRDCALGLLRRGHRPVAYAPKLGRTADFLRQQTIPVVDDLALITAPPDIIHGSHTPTIIESIVRFPQVPAVQICQSVGYPMSEPLFLPQVRKFIAVDENTRDYLVGAGVAPDKIRLVHNCVDLERIPLRTKSLPDRPKRTLIFTKTESQVPIVMEACRRAGIEVATLGRSVGRVVIDPERELVEYDLIFATARSALEAIAAGAATIVMDGRGLAGMATRANAAWLRKHNFGARSLLHEVTVESVAAAIERYDASEAAALCAYLRPLIDIEPQLDLFEDIHEEIINDFAGSPLSAQELIAALGPVLHRWLPQFPGTDWPWQLERAAMADRIAQLDATLARERTQAIRAGNEASHHVAELDNELAEAEAKGQALREELAAAETGRTNAMAEARSSQQEVALLRASLQTATADSQQAHAAFEAATARADTLDRDVAALRASLQTATADSQQAHAAFEAATARADTLDRDVAALRASLQTATADSQQARAAFEAAIARVETLDRDVAALRATLETATADLQQLRAALETVTAEAAALGREVAGMQRSAFWRLRDQIVRRPTLYRALRSLFDVSRGRLR